MKLITFDPYRALNLNAHYIKPEAMFRERETINKADWVLFPEYWQVNALVYGLKKRIFPNINTYHLGHDKIEMTRAFWSIAPAHVPDTLILPATPTGIDQVLEHFHFPFVAKEIRNSMGRGVFLIQNRSQFLDYAKQNPVLYAQEYLPIQKDLRVIVIGDSAITAYWRIAPADAFHNNIARGGTTSFEDIPAAAITLVERTAQQLGINHAGFDIADVGGHYYFLEFNPLFGDAGLKDRGIDIEKHIGEYLLQVG